MNADGIYKRVKATIRSCRTKEQLENAARYMNQYTEHFGKDEHYDDLIRVYKEKDAALFPPIPEEEI